MLGGEPVHSDNDLVASIDGHGLLIGTVTQRCGEVPAVDARECATPALDCRHLVEDRPLGRIRHLLEDDAAAERIDHRRDPGFECDDLLGAQGEGGGFGGGHAQRLVIGADVHGLRTAQCGCECLDGGSDGIVERLLSSEGRARREGEDPQLLGARVFGPVGLAHEPCPHATRGAEFRDLGQELHIRRQEGEQGRSDGVDAHPTTDRLIEIGARIREGEGHLLCSTRTGLANVVAAHRQGDPPRDVRRDVLDDVDGQLQPCRRREDLRAAREVLLQDVVLDEHPEGIRIDATLFGERLEHRSPHIADGVGRRAHLADALERDTVHEDLDVGQGVDRDTDLADLTASQRVIGVQTHLSRKIQRDTESGEALVEQRPEARIGLGRSAEAGVLTHGPHARIGADPPGVRVLPREFEGAAGRHLVASASSCSRSTFLAILPVELRGNSSTARTSLGFL